MEKARQTDCEDDAGDQGSLVLVTESFELPALDLLSMASPALTTDGGDTGLYSVRSEGLSMITEDKDALSDWKDEDGEDEDGEEGQDEDKEDQDEDVAGGELTHQQTDQKESAETRLDESSQGNEEDEEEDAKGDGNHDAEAMAEEEDDAQDPAETKSQDRHSDQQHRQSRKSSASSENPSTSATPRRDSLSDDDMTVECASPRDPVDLDEDTESAPQVGIRHSLGAAHNMSRAADSSPAVVHPLPLPVAESARPISTTSSNAYSVKSIFPVVYEAPHVTNSASTRDFALIAGPNEASKGNKQQPPPVPTRQLRDQSSSAVQPGASKLHPIKLERDVVERMHALRDEVEMLKDQLQKATKGLNLQLQVAQSDRNQLSQRNTRLKAQVTTLAVDLTRTKADAAKLKVENELYAAKLPKLQAELSEETSQADEKHAVTIQSQLEITQLRAKVQVLQTRSVNLDAQVEKLQQELRSAKKEMRRRTILHQQTDEKLKRVENELQESQAQHAQEILNAKNKVAVTFRRLEHERVKAEAETTKKHQQQFDEVKVVAAKAVRRRKELEQVNNNVEQQLAVLKRRVESESDDSRDLTGQRRELEAALVRAERTESSLRNEICSLKAQVHTLEGEKNKLLRSATHRAPVVTRATRRSPQMVQQRSPSPGRDRRGVPSTKKDMFESPQETTDMSTTSLCSCCRAILDSVDRLDRMDSHGLADEPLESTTEDALSTWVCIRCPKLVQEIEKAHEELLQVRQLHANELKVQANAFERAISMVRGAVAIH